jgi:hypothetical protein
MENSSARHCTREEITTGSFVDRSFMLDAAQLVGNAPNKYHLDPRVYDIVDYI